MERFGMDANEMLIDDTLSRQLTVKYGYFRILDPWVMMILSES